MNWSKAKSILILALVATNLILLGLFFYDRYKLSPYEYSASFAKEAKGVLEDHQIGVDVDIPTAKKTFPSLEVSFESLDLEVLKKKFFSGPVTLERDDPNLKILKMGKVSLSIIDNRRILYERDFSGDRGALSLESAQKVAGDFLASRGYPTDDYQLTWKKSQGSSWDLVYTKVYKGHYVESTYMAFTIEGNQVTRMDRLWIDVLGGGEGALELQSASKALLSLLDKPEAQGRTIKSIDPCYFFNPEEQGAIEDLTRSLVGKTGLAWRVVLDNGEEVMLSE